MSKTAMQTVNHDSLSSAKEPRFAFGKNWERFLRYLNDERIAEAEKSLRGMLDIEDLKGKSFIDIGSGSGLFSLAAMRLGADRIHSFDYDPHSVACTQELKRRFFPDAGNWRVEQGSALDREYLASLGQFDVVYSWGVLHHTGSMWQALENVVPVIARDGKLFIALYNEQRMYSRVWKAIKRRYSKGAIWRPFIIAGVGSYFAARGFVADLCIRRRNPLDRYRHFQESRGMSYLTDLIDWVGGYPFEVAKPDEVFHFFHLRGFELVKLKTVGGELGCNEFVLVKRGEACRP